MRTTILTVLLVMFAFSCNTTEPPPPTEYNLKLEVLDASSTEAWLRVTMTDPNTPTTIGLLRDEKSVQTLELIGSDSVLMDQDLAPSQTYIYKAVQLVDSIVVDSSEPLQLTTLDTTSHQWLFELQLLGDAASSELFDVAVINDTLAYAVGEISFLDSSGQIINPPFNLAKWDGRNWEYMTLRHNCRLYYPNCGPDTLLYEEARSIHAFGADDIWVASGTAHHFDGERWTEHAGIQGVGFASEIWGNDPNDVWFVGRDGFIARYINGAWQQVESGTTLDVNDIHGSTNTDGAEEEVLAVAAKRFVTLDREVLKFTGNTVTSVSDNGIMASLAGLWFKPDRRYYVVGSGVYSKLSVSDSTEWEPPHSGVTQYYINGIDANGLNDIVACGDFGEVLHFNGITWQSYSQMTSISSGVYYSLDATENLLIAVGFESPQAVVAIGRR